MEANLVAVARIKQYSDITLEVLYHTTYYTVKNIRISVSYTHLTLPTILRV